MSTLKFYVEEHEKSLAKDFISKFMDAGIDFDTAKKCAIIALNETKSVEEVIILKKYIDEV